VVLTSVDSYAKQSKNQTQRINYIEETEIEEIDIEETDIEETDIEETEFEDIATLSNGNIDLYATSAVLIDAESGRVLFGKNQDAVLPMASTTKIMTCILVLENADMNEVVDISAYAAGMPEVKLFARTGEQFLVRDLLYSLMLESHNDTAIALAEHIGKRLLPESMQMTPASQYSKEESKQAVAAFAGMMNQKAKELGCENTYFITPNGLDAEEMSAPADGETVIRQHSTTATELANILAYCIQVSPKKEDFLTITRTPSHFLTTLEGRSFQCTNHNAFLNMMDGALTGKTGFTNKAGYCYVGAVRRGDTTLIVALLACGWPNNKSYKWSDTRKLMEYGLQTFSRETFTDVAYPEDQLEQLLVEGGRPNHLGEAAYMQLAIQGRSSAAVDRGILLEEGETIQVLCKTKDHLEAPVAQGTLVGSIQYVVDGEVYYSEEIVAAQAISRIDYKWCFRQILERFLA
jgi:D-alanyl-D-alanine carboxypeptidase (penicillin-binding protein 5/6)